MRRFHKGASKVMIDCWSSGIDRTARTLQPEDPSRDRTMLRSTLSSVKPSSLDEIDSSAKSTGTPAKTITSRTTTKVSRGMIAPLPHSSTSTSTSKSRTSNTASLRSKLGNPDPVSSPLHDLFQTIHLSPPLAATAGPSSSTSGSSTRDRPIESFSLHTVVDDTGKWVKLRLYALVDVPRTSGESRLQGAKEEGGGVTGGKRRRLAMDDGMKTGTGVRGSMINSKESRHERQTVRSTSTKSYTITTTTTSNDVKLEEREHSETEDEIDPEPMGKREEDVEDHREDQGVEGGMEVDLGVGVWKGYLRLSKVEHPHTPNTIAKSISEGLLHVVPGDIVDGQVSKIGTEVGGRDRVVLEGDGEVKLIVSLPSDMARDANPVKPLIIPCQSAQAGVAGGQAGRLVMEETLRGWWNVGCKIIAKHNTVSKELWTMQDRRTRPLPSSLVTPAGAASGSQVPTLSQSGARPASQDRPGMDVRKASGVKTDPNYEDYLALVKEVQALRVENRQLSQENSALKGGYAGKLSLSQQSRGGPGSQAMGARQMPPGMSKIQPGIRRPPKIESGFASSSDDD